MVQVQPTNEKLVVRATNIISAITGADKETAHRTLTETGMQVPDAIVIPPSYKTYKSHLLNFFM